MSNISVSNKLLAKAMASAFGSKPQVSRYWDDHRKDYVDILTCVNAPQANVNSYGTLGLSDCRLLNNGKDVGLRVEFVSACGARHKEFANILSTAAFCVINSGWYPSPGGIFSGLISMYQADTDMEHLLFTSPFLWEDLKTLDLDDKTVAWLMLVPISERERKFAENNGSGALEDLFVEKQIDVFNLDRTSIL
jgi:hypothetical protein